MKPGSFTSMKKMKAYAETLPEREQLDFWLEVQAASARRAAWWMAFAVFFAVLSIVIMRVW